MGWDTEIVILAEGISAKEVALDVQKHIFDKDSKWCGKETCFVIKERSEFCLYYHYERRKYAPYSAVQEISKKFPEVQFTILGSMPDFLCGPGGIIRISDGVINDSYGVWPYESMRYSILNEPISQKEAIYEWYKNNGYEDQQRRLYHKQYPLDWCEGDFYKKLIPIDDNRLKELIEHESYETSGKDWEEQSKIKLIPDYEQYQEDLNNTPQDSLTIDDRSFMAFIEYNSNVREIESEFESLVPCKVFNLNLLGLYRSTFGLNSSNRKFLLDKFQTVQDMEDLMVEKKSNIIEYGRKIMAENSKRHLNKGYSFIWLMQLLKDDKI